MKTALAGVILAASSTFGLAATPPPVGTQQYECRQTWEHLLVCKDRKTGRVVSECRFNNMTKTWECQSR